MNHYQAIIDSPLGPLGLMIDTAGALTVVDFLSAGHPLQAPDSESARAVQRALDAYFEDPRRPFDLPIAPTGTVYQRRVWSGLSSLRPGEICTYGELADRLHSGPRAVGQACRRNPIPIVVPCHRVVARQGAGGYSGASQGPQLGIKYWLLRHEGVIVDRSGSK